MNSDYQNAEWYQLTMPSYRCVIRKVRLKQNRKTEHGNLEVADSSLRIFTVVFHLHFFSFSLTNFLLFCCIYIFKELTEVHKCACAVYGHNTTNGFKKSVESLLTSDSSLLIHMKD